MHTSFPSAGQIDYTRWPTLLAGLCLPVFLLIALSLEKFAQSLAERFVRKHKGVQGSVTPSQEVLVWVLQMVNILLLLWYPVKIISIYRPSPGPNVLLLLFVVTWAMVSYCRHCTKILYSAIIHELSHESVFFWLWLF
jgi:hypothetical protein